MTIEGIQSFWLKKSEGFRIDKDGNNSDNSENEKKESGNRSNRNVSGSLGDVVAE